ncbi:unnamed protein product [Urochloa decumbens]|uniref:Sugar phosphate transporter domain-containing protein n=1 Tax=Urochloa decumbens TaxID=240449 RepID=A0ABC9FRN3_9POAL
MTKRKSKKKNAAGGEEGRTGGGHTKTTLQLGALLGLWHLFTVHNKQVLKIFPFPMNVTTLQFAVGTASALLMWTTGILKRPKVSSAQIASILPLAIVHTMANLLTNMSPGKVAVSFTHVDKAHRDLKRYSSFPVPLSSMILQLGQLLIPWVVLCLVPTVTFQSRNVMRGSLGAINLFSVVIVMSFLFLVPVTFLTEGVRVTPAALQSTGLNLKQILKRSIFAA